MKSRSVLVCGAIFALGVSCSASVPAGKGELSRALLEAAFWGDNQRANVDVAKVSRLVEQGADANIRDAIGRTPFLKAALACNEPVVRLMIRKGAQVNRADRDGFTALMWASSGGGELDYHWDGSPGIVKMLLDHGARVNAKGPGGASALLFAFQTRRRETREKIVNLLLSHGARVNVAGNDGGTPLMAACFEGDLALVKRFIKAGAKVNARDTERRTCLTYALLGAKEKHEGKPDAAVYREIVRRLKAAGAVE